MNLITWLSRTLGRFLFAIPFLLFGVMHFMFGGQMADLVPLPLGIIWVYVTGVALIAASVSIMIGKKDKLATGLLGILLVLFALLVHIPGMTEAAAMFEAATEGAYEQLHLKHSERFSTGWCCILVCRVGWCQSEVGGEPPSPRLRTPMGFKVGLV